MIVDLVRSRFRERGFRLVDDEVLEEFMKKYRVRDTSGLNAPLSKAIKEETGAEAVPDHLSGGLSGKRSPHRLPDSPGWF